MSVIGDAQRHNIVTGENKTRSTSLRGAANASPIVLAIATV